MLPISAERNSLVAEIPVLKEHAPTPPVRPPSKLSLKRRGSTTTIISQQTPVAKKQCTNIHRGLNIDNKAPASNNIAKSCIAKSHNLGFTLPHPDFTATPVSQSDPYNMSACPMPGSQPHPISTKGSQSVNSNMAHPMLKSQPHPTPVQEGVSADTIKKVE